MAIARASASSPDDITEALLAAEARTQPDMPRPAGVPQNLDDVSRLAIRQALEAARGNMSAAARTLGISRQTLHRKLAVH